MGKKRTERIVFENVQILDAGAKGVSVAKAPDGKVIFLPNVVPGDVVDVQTMKKRKAFYEGKAITVKALESGIVDLKFDKMNAKLTELAEENTKLKSEYKKSKRFIMSRFGDNAVMNPM